MIANDLEIKYIKYKTNINIIIKTIFNYLFLFDLKIHFLIF